MNPETPASTVGTPKKKKKSNAWVWVILLVLAGVGAYLWFPRVTEGEASKQKKGKNDAGKAVPVVAAMARQGDMPVYLVGLGNVSAFYTVMLHSRVDGQVMEVKFTEGQLVKKDDPLIEVDPRPFQVQLEQAEGQLARDEALLNNALVDQSRYKVLWDQDAIPKQQLDTQMATVKQYQATIQSDKAQIDNAKLNLVYSHITAPITGRIGLRMVDPGNIVHASDTNSLAAITQLQPIAVIFNIAEDKLPAVRKKAPNFSGLRVDAYGSDNKVRIATGTLATVDNQIDVSTGNLKFKAIYDNTDNALFPNQFINARLLLDTRHGTVIIPSAAIQPGSLSSFVYVVKADNTIEVRNVVSTLTDGDQAAIDSGIETGEVVVVDGADKLQQGSKVTVRMAQPKAPKG